MNGSRNAMIRWLFEDRETGRIVIGQTPNALAILVVASYAARFASPSDKPAGPALRILGTSALCVWAVDEATRGVNPFRRLAGAIVLATIAGMRTMRQVPPDRPRRTASDPR